MKKSSLGQKLVKLAGGTKRVKQDGVGVGPVADILVVVDEGSGLENRGRSVRVSVRNGVGERKARPYSDDGSEAGGLLGVGVGSGDDDGGNVGTTTSGGCTKHWRLRTMPNLYASVGASSRSAVSILWHISTAFMVAFGGKKKRGDLRGREGHACPVGRRLIPCVCFGVSSHIFQNVYPPVSVHNVAYPSR